MAAQSLSAHKIRSYARIFIVVLPLLLIAFGMAHSQGGITIDSSDTTAPSLSLLAGREGGQESESASVDAGGSPQSFRLKSKTGSLSLLAEAHDPESGVQALRIWVNKRTTFCRPAGMCQTTNPGLLSKPTFEFAIPKKLPGETTTAGAILVQALDLSNYVSQVNIPAGDTYSVDLIISADVVNHLGKRASTSDMTVRWSEVGQISPWGACLNDCGAERDACMTSVGGSDPDRPRPQQCVREYRMCISECPLAFGIRQPSMLPICREPPCGPEEPPDTPEPPPVPRPGPSPIDIKYAALGGPQSFLGAPTLPTELTAPDGVGRYRHYEHGSIYWSPNTGAHEVHGYIRGKWASLGWERSYLGYPTSDELATPDGTGRYSLFNGGIIYWSPQQEAIDTGPAPVEITDLPAADTPILETIYDIDQRVIAPYHATGVFEFAPGYHMELRLRAPEQTKVQVEIAGNPLAEVSPVVSHSGLDGYYWIVEKRKIDDVRAFWRIEVVLPQDKQGDVDFQLTVRDTSLNPTMTGAMHSAPPLHVSIRRPPIEVSKPSEVFFNQGSVLMPDQKQWKGPDACGITIDGTFRPDECRSTGFIADDVTVAGWLAGTPYRNEAGDTEDWHYNLFLDNDFIERNYYADTLPLAVAVMPGTWYTWFDDQKAFPFPHSFRKKILLTGGQQPSAATFLMPGRSYLTVELNAWHKSKHDNTVPYGWEADPQPKWPDVFWPFNPMSPQDSGSELAAGDYVIITGALVEDSGHLHPGDDPDEGGGCSAWLWYMGKCEDETPYPSQEFWHNRCWHKNVPGHGGWLEIHPMDSLRRVDGPRMLVRNPATSSYAAVPLRKYSQVFDVCSLDDDRTTRQGFERLQVPTVPKSDVAPTPDPLESLARNDPNAVIRYQETIDTRFTDMSTVEEHTVAISRCDPTKLDVRTNLKLGWNGHFMAVYQVWWAISDQPRPTPAPCPTPVPPSHPSENVCRNKPWTPGCD